jgi:hypothetical protein
MAVPEARHRWVIAVGLVADVGTAGCRGRRLVDAPVVAVGPVARGVAARAAGRVGRGGGARRRVQRLLGIASGGAAVSRARSTCNERRCKRMTLIPSVRCGLSTFAECAESFSLALPSPALDTTDDTR